MRARSWLRLLGGALVLAVLLWRFGTGPFVEAWRVTTWWAVLAALVLTSFATLTSAWRWRVVAGRLGVPVAPGPAVAAYYRSQFLNATLPGGILGDAHRAVRHGREAGDLPAGLRATLWERLGGQAVQVGLAVLAVLLLPSPLRPFAPLAVAVAVAVGMVAWWLRRRGDAARPGFVAADLRALLERRTASRVALASAGSTAAHLGVFLVAVLAVGVAAPLTVLVATALVVLVVSSVPVSIAGWGPREGVTAWAFGFAGLGSAAGLTVSVVYGVLAAVATLPGAVVLGAEAVRGRGLRRAATPPAPLTSSPVLEEARHG
ncbi:lysylphosphatidylglycerol synthase transmembrane domain-containing protein [Nocardioides cynanchi]|uniref:lysylphosphatidylglycerol synthase transmembrane domain-containing protein n=1 Tax=Nocardioides cynanchi TaxID=2558918 RepID=UPI0012463A66|nr:lysylphosphatidylglycerol synthase transmembrane domain-containing protein [Nocardioides cynanchi]